MELIVSSFLMCINLENFSKSSLFQDIGKGKIVVDAQGGQAPYEYYYEPITTPLAAVLTDTTLDNAFIINQQGTSLDVVSGYYRVYIRDNAGCLVHTVVTVDIDPSPSRNLFFQ